MQPMSLTPARKVARQKSSISGVISLLGRALAASLVLAAGCAGWFAAERYGDGLLDRPAETSTAVAAALPSLGEGLPNERLVPFEPWRRFNLTYTDGAKTELY